MIVLISGFQATANAPPEATNWAIQAMELDPPPKAVAKPNPLNNRHNLTSSTLHRYPHSFPKSLRSKHP